MNRGLAALVVLVGVFLVASGCGSAHQPSGTGSQATSLPGLTAAKLAKLTTLARSTATADGDAHPTSATVFASRRHEANIAAGAGTGVFGRQPVYLLVLNGSFTCSDCTGPPGGAEPKGDVVTLVVDRSTLRGLDFGFGGPVDTSNVGPGLPLRLDK